MEKIEFPEEITEIKIGKQDFRFYSGQCNVKFRIQDRLILTGMESFKEKIVYVKDSLSGYGVEVDRDFRFKRDEGKNKAGDIKWGEIMRDVEDEKTGRIQKKKVYFVVITKNPDDFKHTDKNKGELELG